MSTKKILSTITWALLAANVLLMFIFRPYSAAFFGMTFLWRAVYVIVLCGYPLLVLIPVALLMLPVALIPYNKHPFRTRFANLARYAFLSVSGLAFIINSLVVIAKYGGGKFEGPPKYSEIMGTEMPTDDLRAGRFTDKYGSIIRYGSLQAETYASSGRTIPYTIEWLSDSEYRLTRPAAYNPGMSDTLLVKITANKSDHYVCYVKYGEYAEKMIINKK